MADIAHGRISQRPPDIFFQDAGVGWELDRVPEGNMFFAHNQAVGGFECPNHQLGSNRFLDCEVYPPAQHVFQGRGIVGQSDDHAGDPARIHGVEIGHSRRAGLVKIHHHKIKFVPLERGLRGLAVATEIGWNAVFLKRAFDRNQGLRITAKQERRKRDLHISPAKAIPDGCIGPHRVHFRAKPGGIL